MDFVQTTLDNESVKIINITGSEKNTSIAYVDSLGNLKVKVKPVDWSLNQILNTSNSKSVSNNSKIRQRRVIITGDSISSSNPPGQWPHIATITNNGVDYVIVWSDSLSSTNLEQILARLDNIPSYVIADEIWIQGGTNADSSGGFGDTQKNKDAIINIAIKCLFRGWKPVFIMPPPTTSKVKEMSDLAKWLNQYCITNGYDCLNIWVDSIDPATGQMKASSSYDGTHPTTSASKEAAKRINEYVRSGSILTPQYPVIELTNISNINKAPNPLCLSSTGGLATGWTAHSGQGTSTPSIVSASWPFVGNLQKFSDSIAITQYCMHRRSAISVTPGKRYRISEYIKIDSVTDPSPSGQSVGIVLSIQGSSGGFIPWGASGKTGPNIVNLDGGIFVREIYVPLVDSTITLGYMMNSYANASSGSLVWSIGNLIIVEI